MSKQIDYKRRLYDHPTSQSQTVAVTPKSQSKPTSIIPKADLADRMYSESAGQPNGTYGAELAPALEKMANSEMLSKNDVDAIRKDAANFFGELKIPPNEAARIHETYVKNSLNPPDEETVSAWNDKTTEKLRAKYGEDTESAIAATKEFLKAKGFSQTLSETGMNSHPDFVLPIVEAAWRKKRGLR